MKYDLFCFIYFCEYLAGVSHFQAVNRKAGRVTAETVLGQLADVVDGSIFGADIYMGTVYRQGGIKD